MNNTPRLGAFAFCLVIAITNTQGSLFTRCFNDGGIISNLFPAVVAGYNVFLEIRFRARERLANEAQRAIANSSTSAGLSSQVHAA